MAERRGRDALLDVLDRRAGAGRPVILWWRDDDAVRATPALARLIDLGAAHGIAPVIAAIPRNADESLATVGSERVRFAVHGIAHENRASAGEKKCELASGLPVDEVLADLADGRKRLGRIVGQRLIDMLVPPWNRIAQEIADQMGDSGLTVLSGFGPTDRATSLSGIAIVNSHVDIIDWRGTRGGHQAEAVFEKVAGVAEAALAGDQDRPLGILTHHLVHDAAAWQVLDQLFELTSKHPGVEWCAPGSLPGVGTPRPAGGHDVARLRNTIRDRTRAGA